MSFPLELTISYICSQICHYSEIKWVFSRLLLQILVFRVICESEALSNEEEQRPVQLNRGLHDLRHKFAVPLFADHLPLIELLMRVQVAQNDRAGLRDYQV